ncbi:MAG: FAD-dependent thymidylate synthase [Clostridia bacterium]|nr:FAD-dependent thymidylate synthase [Clostridia bacterium]
MNIRTILHSELDCHLKPDLDLIKQGISEIFETGKIKDHGAIAEMLSKVEEATTLINKEKSLASKLKTASNEEKQQIKQEKDITTDKADVALEDALTLLMKVGGKDAYHYDYDNPFNMVVAGLMGSTCYMKEDFKALQEKRIRNILTISNVVLNNGHHSTFGHSHVTLEISQIPKALAMILNNEKECAVSEKSARYTVMDQIEPKELELYEKWKDIFTREITQKYGDSQPFFDEKGVRATKLAQENARYMISAFTPTNMVYTTSFRQLNYLAHWLKNELNNPNSNKFYAGVKTEMSEFIAFVKANNLYLENLEDHKDRKLSLFGPGVLGETLSSETYTLNYNTSIACLAQAHRHRTIGYRINEFRFNNEPSQFFLPPLLKNLGDQDLINQWFEDIRSVEETIPQGKLVNVVENGETKNFLLKALERECSEAQWEVMDLTRRYSQKFSDALKEEIAQGTEKANSLDGLDKEDAINSIESIKQMQTKFEKLSNGARCTAGYKCLRPCGFKDGITLERDI